MYSATIKMYLAGVRLFHIDNHVADPTKEAPLFHYLCTAIRYNGDNKRSTLPITLLLLHVLISELSCKQSLAPLDKTLFWAAFTLAFHGFLHASK